MVNSTPVLSNKSKWDTHLNIFGIDTCNQHYQLTWNYGEICINNFILTNHDLFTPMQQETLVKLNPVVT